MIQIIGLNVNDEYCRKHCAKCWRKSLPLEICTDDGDPAVQSKWINPLSPELNPICYLLALLAHHFLHVSRIRVKSLTLRLLMSYIYGAPILDVSRSHTMTRTTVGRTPLDE
jgi:hypothetical protein